MWLLSLQVSRSVKKELEFLLLLEELGDVPQAVLEVVTVNPMLPSMCLYYSNSDYFLKTLFSEL